MIKGVEVKRIIEENKNIKGVELNNGEKILADNVVCNADPPGVYEKLLNRKKGNLFFNWKRNRMDYSMGLFVYYFGTNKVYSYVDHHTIKF